MEEKFPVLEDLIVWKKCRELRIELSNLTKTFPGEEKFRFND